MAITGYMSRLPPPPEPAQLAAVVKALKGSKKPVIYLGGGTLDAGEAAGCGEAGAWISRAAAAAETGSRSARAAAGAHGRAPAFAWL
jgi:thiamine pyrophosphate-dependent acetolactate synthase large subunit-like protein